MPVPWYEQYFTADYWTYADEEYDDSRTAAEVDYLTDVLRRRAPGRKVLDLGCGVGRHAVALATRGFDVTGVDVSQFALSRAAVAAREAGVDVRLHRADVLGATDWGAAGVDAVICVQAFGWGTDADQLRLLRAARRLLAPGGVLVLDHSNILAIAAIYQPQARAEIGGVTFHFVRRYDAITGRSNGEVRVRRADGSSAVLPDNVRMYQPTEVRAMLTRAGFDILAADADFTVGAHVTLNTRYVQFVARPRTTVESALDGHRRPAPTTGLDLRWAPDEVEFVAGALSTAWADLRADAATLEDRARRYEVADPYGAQRATAILATALRLPEATGLSTGQVTVGAGATGLLHNLAALADGGVVLIDSAGHPHLGAAAEGLGNEVRVADLSDLGEAVAAVERRRPAVTVLDRPGLRGPAWSISDVGALAVAARSAGGVLVVDETCANYLPPADSAAALIARVPGLIVVRSMSKGYCSGGLRVGFAIASPDIACAVRSVLAPLAVSALSLDLALALLRQSDPLGALRRRVAEVKPPMRAALASAGIPAHSTDPHVPWLVLPDTVSIRKMLAGQALTVKDAPVRHQDGRTSTLLRMAVPLSVARREALERALIGIAADPTRQVCADAPG